MTFTKRSLLATLVLFAAPLCAVDTEHLPMATILTSKGATKEQNNMVLFEPTLDGISQMTLGMEGSFTITNIPGDVTDETWCNVQSMNEKECANIVTALEKAPANWSMRGTDLNSLLYMNRLRSAFVHLKPTDKQLYQLVHNYLALINGWIEAKKNEAKNAAVLAQMERDIQKHAGLPLSIIAAQRATLKLTGGRLLHFSNAEVEDLLQREADLATQVKQQQQM